jgi:hypothetical protein
MGERCTEEMAGCLHVARGRLASACLLAAVWLAAPAPAVAQSEPRCMILCAPELKIEPTWTIENLGGARQVEVDGQVESIGVGSVFELVLALDIPTTIPRVSFTFETIFDPFVSDNSVEIETEFNFHLFDTDRTGGWVSSHFDVVDQFSPGETPRADSSYTHKLDFEWDTAFHLFNRMPQGQWLRNVEAEVSLDYLATGLPKAGDVVGGTRFLDDANPWSFSMLMIIPLAPLAP